MDVSSHQLHPPTDILIEPSVSKPNILRDSRMYTM